MSVSISREKLAGFEAALRTGVWHGDSSIHLRFPEGWKVRLCSMKGAPALTPKQLRESIENPVGADPLYRLAEGKRTAAVVLEDITRPAPLHIILAIVLDELNRGGIQDKQISIVLGTGTHRAMTRQEALLKMGASPLARCALVDHNPYDNLTFLGTTSRKNRVLINSRVASADLVVGIGGVYPHGAAGYSGGCKIIIPGVAGIETIEANHSLPGTVCGILEGSVYREDLEEGTRLAGLRWIVNAVVNEGKEICGLFCGDSIRAHRAACRFAGEVYATQAGPADVVVANAYPMDTELFQAAKALGAAVEIPGSRIIVLVADCPNGFGYHALCQPGGRLHGKEIRDTAVFLAGKQLMVLSPNIEHYDVIKKFPPGTILCKTWQEAVDQIQSIIPGTLNAVVLPTAPIQLIRRGASEAHLNKGA